jgi:hypothetical protein
MELEKLSINELKGLAKELGIDGKGNKAELAARIAAARKPEGEKGETPAAGDETPTLAADGGENKPAASTSAPKTAPPAPKPTPKPKPKPAEEFLALAPHATCFDDPEHGIFLVKGRKVPVPARISENLRRALIAGAVVKVKG